MQTQTEALIERVALCPTLFISKTVKGLTLPEELMHIAMHYSYAAESYNDYPLIVEWQRGRLEMAGAYMRVFIHLTRPEVFSRQYESCYELEMHVTEGVCSQADTLRLGQYFGEHEALRRAMQAVEYFDAMLGVFYNESSSGSKNEAVS